MSKEQDYSLRNTTPFPHGITIEDCRNAIKGLSCFREKLNKEDGTIAFNYDFLQNDSFPNPYIEKDSQKSFYYKVRRECRGIIFDANTKALICRKFHKFFNINENLECHESAIDMNQDFILMEKIDGSLIAPFILQDIIRWGSKMGITELGLRLEEFIARSKEYRYNEFSMVWLKKGFSVLFEYTSMDQQIILTYKEDSLRVIGIRDMFTGDYVPWDDVKSTCKEYGIPIVDIIDHKNHPSFKDIKNTKDLVNAVRNVKGIEGYVIRFSSGKTYKIKTQFYMDLAKICVSSEQLMKCEKDVWAIILGGQLDDVLATMNSNTRSALNVDKIKEFSNTLFQRIEDVSKTIIEHIISAKEKNCQRKSFQNLKFPTGYFSGRTLQFAYHFFDLIQKEDTVDRHISTVSKALVQRCLQGTTSGSKLLDTKDLLGSNINFGEELA
ncbi:hypothetical protein DLAC_06083 [Tieghemostelium lacteum]|uniref:T4 RNA ligase 1-like N-terminal domain-containing protein n=1 Tax=Tieghemostelium lacteum TaxID=361077 RepID=A0A151ZHP0_TIELA|nr:hypothetical protein DLAC_06083 [Tieghemostelium lacteum]|eukprot:KYQ93400.1 hypothetical protein DLAC_06083 [Tieghemostelium lacteum]